MTKEQLEQLKAEGKIKGFAEKETGAKPRKKPSNEESKLQQSIVREFRKKYPQYAARFYAIPNGGKRSVITATILKAEGAVKGVPDLVFTLPVGKWAGAYFEVKTEKGRLTPEQIAFIKEHQDTHFCRVVRSVEQFLTEINNYLKTKK